MTDLKDNVTPLRDAVENAETATDTAVNGGDGGGNAPPQDPPGNDEGQENNEYGLPAGCPVTPLGTHNGNYYFLDRLNQIWALPGDKISRNNIASMFSPDTHLLKKFWPRLKKIMEKSDVGELVEKWIVTGFRAEDAGDDLRDACSRQGVWRSFEKIRGAGAWLDGDGKLIFHCGDALVSLVDGEFNNSKPGTLAGMVYPTAPALPHPIDYSQDPDGAGLALLNQMKSWNWARKEHDVDAQLMLGWIVCALLGGALDWRPMAFITGDRATGKSTLHKLIGYVMGGAIIQTANTTAAGIYQHVGQSSLPVSIDELENDADNRRQKAIIELARQSSSGALMLRGGAEHKGVEFTARSCFLFSSIIMPPFPAQDLSRMAVLCLNELEQGAPPPKMDAKALCRMGQEMRGRILKQWDRWIETLECYWHMLAGAGHSARACDQFGALLAAADMVLYSSTPDGDTLDEWAQRLSPELMAETAQNLSDAERCLSWLCESQPDQWRGGGRMSLSDLAGEYVRGNNDGATANALASGGCAVPVRGKYAKRYLAVGISHRGAALVFENSSWAGTPGNPGPWAQALRRLQGAEDATVKIGGRTARCVMVPIELVYEKEEPRSGTASSRSIKETAEF